MKHQTTLPMTRPDGSATSAYCAMPASGHGPGLVLCHEIFGVNETMRTLAERYAEEGYVVLVPDLFSQIRPGVDLGYGEEDHAQAFALLERFDIDAGLADVALAARTLRESPATTGQVGAVGYCLGGRLAYLAAAGALVDCAAGFYGVGIEDHLDQPPRRPLMLHFGDADRYCPPETVSRIAAHLAGSPDARVHRYPDADHAFAREGSPLYRKPAALVSYERTIAFLHEYIGPRHDLSALWDRHTELEFEVRDAAETMRTMVAEPYVNHIPTLTGGVGARQLHRFYKHHFIPSTPKDTRLIPISRTVGATQIVDEQLFCFTHDEEIEWMLPGIAPTGRYVEIPLVAVVKFRGDKLCHEHIYWDQASVLVQIGVLDPAGLPVAGRETAAKLLDESLPSNVLMRSWAKSEGKD